LALADIGAAFRGFSSSPLCRVLSSNSDLERRFLNGLDKAGTA
jgi:hypothetical protein